MDQFQDDYYAVLEIPVEASTDQIRESYRRLALKCHPDKNIGRINATAIFQRLLHAYNVLKDNTLRRDYDILWHRATNSQSDEATRAKHDQKQAQADQERREREDREREAARQRQAWADRRKKEKEDQAREDAQRQRAHFEQLKREREAREQEEFNERQAEIDTQKREREAREAAEEEIRRDKMRTNLGRLRKEKMCIEDNIFETKRILNRLTADLKRLADESMAAERLETQDTPWQRCNPRAERTEDVATQRAQERLQHTARQTIKTHELELVESRFRQLEDDVDQVEDKIYREKLELGIVQSSDVEKERLRRNNKEMKRLRAEAKERATKAEKMRQADVRLATKEQERAEHRSQMREAREAREAEHKRTEESRGKAQEETQRKQEEEAQQKRDEEALEWNKKAQAWRLAMEEWKMRKRREEELEQSRARAREAQAIESRARDIQTKAAEAAKAQATEAREALRKREEAFLTSQRIKKLALRNAELDQDERSRQTRAREVATEDRMKKAGVVIQTDCTHRAFWHKREGSRQCQQCRQPQPYYTFECPGCNLFACADCRQLLRTKSMLRDRGTWR